MNGALNLYLAAHASLYVRIVYITMRTYAKILLTIVVYQRAFYSNLDV